MNNDKNYLLSFPIVYATRCSECLLSEPGFLQYAATFSLHADFHPITALGTVKTRGEKTVLKLKSWQTKYRIKDPSWIQHIIEGNKRSESESCVYKQQS